MKLNIFLVPQGNVAAVKDKFGQVGLNVIHSATEGPWQTGFYFSERQEPDDIPWVNTFAEFFGDPRPQNLIYFGAYVFEATRILLHSDLWARRTSMSAPSAITTTA